MSDNAELLELLRMVSGPITDKPEPEDGTEWINPISGLRYRWDAKQKLWVSTGTYPLGTNPMGFLGDGVLD